MNSLHALLVVGILLDPALTVSTSPGRRRAVEERPAPGFSPGRTDTLVRGWRQDLKLLAEEMPRRHKNLFHSMSRGHFDSALKKLNERLPTLERYQLVVEIMRLVALVGDGHTTVEGNLGFRSYPIVLYQFSDGLFVVAADSAHAEAVGGRVIQVGEAPVEQALREVSRLVSHDNEMGPKSLAPLFLTRPEILRALGLVGDMETASLLVERNGRRTRVNLKPLPPSRIPLGFWFSDRPPGWVDMREGTRVPVPLWLRDPRNNYWFEYLAETRTVYVQLNAIASKPDEPLPAFAKRLFDFVDSHEVDRFVLDLRWNGGGDNSLNRILVVGLIKAAKIDQPGRLFTIIGRRTFSAAQNLVNDLENFTTTIFVGEPTASRVNMYGDARPIPLPHIGIGVRVSSVWWQQMPERDRRRWTAPGLAAELSSEDYRKNVDPAMRLILGHVPKDGFAEQLARAARTRDVPLTTEVIRRLNADPEAAANALREFAADPVNRYVPIETLADALGTFVMEGNFLASALRVFELNTTAFPGSSHAYSSLALAYERRGDRDLAIQNYTKALELDPANQTAIEGLRRSKAPSARRPVSDGSQQLY